MVDAMRVGSGEASAIVRADNSGLVGALMYRHRLTHHVSAFAEARAEFDGDLRWSATLGLRARW